MLLLVHSRRGVGGHQLCDDSGGRGAALDGRQIFWGHLTYMSPASFMAHCIAQLSLMSLTAAFKLTDAAAKAEYDGVRLNSYYYNVRGVKCVQTDCTCPARAKNPPGADRLARGGEVAVKGGVSGGESKPGASVAGEQNEVKASVGGAESVPWASFDGEESELESSAGREESEQCASTDGAKNKLVVGRYVAESAGAGLQGGGVANVAAWSAAGGSGASVSGGDND